MRKFQLGRTGLDVSAVAFGGFMLFGRTDEEARTYVDTAIERGVNYFDVAPAYGDSQDRLGPALKKYRDDVYLACKTVERTAEGAKAELLNSLKILQTDHFDVYQLHCLMSPDDVDTVFGKGGAMETLLWAKREGIIRNIGFSTHSEEAGLAAMKRFDYDTALFPMNWAIGINDGWGDRTAALAKEQDVGLIAMKTLAHRLWLDEAEHESYPNSWTKPITDNDALSIAAIKYGFLKGAATQTSPGNFGHFCFMLDHVDACCDQPITDAEWALLRSEAAKVRDMPIFKAGA